jgi:hypothetical protein
MLTRAMKEKMNERVIAVIIVIALVLCSAPEPV